MIQAEEEERKMHIKSPANREVSSGFKHEKSESSLRGGPAESWFSFSEADDDSLQTIVERYNLIMQFLSKKSQSPADREAYATIILNVLPNLQSLEISEIESMLQFLG